MGGVDFTVLPVDPMLVAVARKHAEKLAWTTDWHAAVRRTQDTLEMLGLAEEITRDLMPSLRDILRCRDILVQSNLYLRAARPNETYDAIGWHRESMYGGEPQCFNVWIPVLNVTPENTIKYIPGSAAIPDAAIKTEHADDGQVEQGSDAHAIGFLYAPKRIVDGVNLLKSKPMIVPPNHAAVFPGSLIHGAAQNRTGKVRYSVDFRIIAKEHARRPHKWRELSNTNMSRALASGP